MKIRTKATLAASIAALPFLLLAAALWSVEDTYMGFEHLLGYHIYLLGAPLTLLIKVYVARFGYLQSSDNWWAIPVMSGLFIAQWIIWAQLLVPVWRRFAASRACSAAETSDGHGRGETPSV